MTFVLQPEEAYLLVDHLTRWINHLEVDLVHTDKRELQRSLAGELVQLHALADRLRSALEHERPPPERLC